MSWDVGRLRHILIIASSHCICGFVFCVSTLKVLQHSNIVRFINTFIYLQRAFIPSHFMFFGDSTALFVCLLVRSCVHSFVCLFVALVA